MSETTPETLRLDKLKPFLQHASGCGALVPPHSYCSCGLHYAYDEADLFLRDAARLLEETRAQIAAVEKLAGQWEGGNYGSIQYEAAARHIRNYLQR